ncbi:MAG TPA: cobalamin B12-binding domain-containing protein [Bryobacteraceae bacterium]|jgi:methylmalonyl-CoA mutase C-terminal domain/subunit
MDQRIRVLVAKPGLDGHDRGAKVIARALRDAGMEVVYTGLRQTPEMIVNAALQEDVQVIGLSILSGAHNTIVPRVMELLKEKHMDDVIVLVGGIVPDEDAAQLKRLGVAAVFQPGASLEGIVEFIRRSVLAPTKGSKKEPAEGSGILVAAEGRSGPVRDSEETPADEPGSVRA